MSTLTIDLDDEAARLVREAARAENQSVGEWLRNNICEAVARRAAPAKALPHRTSPLHPGAMQPTPDFNAPMEDFLASIPPRGPV